MWISCASQHRLVGIAEKQKHKSLTHKYESPTSQLFSRFTFSLCCQPHEHPRFPQYTVPRRPIPLSSLLYFSFFLWLILRPWSTHCEPLCSFIFQDHARSLFLFLSLCSSHKLTEIMTSALHLSISHPGSILAPLHVTQHIPDCQFRATNYFETILNIFCIFKNLSSQERPWLQSQVTGKNE